MVPTEPDRILKVALLWPTCFSTDACLGVAGDGATGLPCSALEGGQLYDIDSMSKTITHVCMRQGKALLRGIAMGVRFVLAEHKTQLKKKTLTRDQVKRLMKAYKPTILASDLCSPLHIIFGWLPWMACWLNILSTLDAYGYECTGSARVWRGLPPVHRAVQGVGQQSHKEYHHIDRAGLCASNSVTGVSIRRHAYGNTWHASKLSGFVIGALVQDDKLRMDLHPTTGFLGAATARLKGIKPGDVQASNLIKLKVST